jgi:hypothetical protein
VPGEAAKQLRERAVVLQEAKEALAAAAAWDDFLAVAPDDLEALEERGELASQGGGPKAAQPFDRRLIQLGGEKLPAPLRRKTWMRLGHAALESEAWRDASDAFEAAFQLEQDGEKGREALSLLAEAASRSRDKAALYKTTLRLAQRSEKTEEEALYRRAAGIFEDEPTRAVDALTWLSKARPADFDLYERTKVAYAELGRLGELLEVHERFAGAAGGQKGALALLDAAELAEGELNDEGKAAELRREASRLDPNNIVALGAVVEEQRKKGDEPGLLETLPRLIEATGDGDPETANALKLELAGLLEKKGDLAVARVTLGSIRSAGASAPGYGAALEALERILKKQNNTSALADVLAARADLAGSDSRSQLLLRAAHAAKAGGELLKAVELTRSALATKATSQGLLLLAELSKASNQLGTAATALAQAAALSDPSDRPRLMIESAETWELAGEKDEAVTALQRLQREHPAALKPAQFAERYLKLGAKGQALEAAFAPAMAAKNYVEALKWADAAEDNARIDEALWAMVQRDGAGMGSERLLERLRAAKAWDGVAKLAGLLDKQGLELWIELFLVRADAKALEAIDRLNGLESVLERVLAQPTAPLLDALLPKAEKLPAPAKEQLWKAAAAVSVSKRPQLLRQLVALYEPWERWADAAKALGELAAEEDDAKERSGFSLRRAELLKTRLNRADLAREAYEQVLTDAPDNADAVRALAGLYEGGEPDQFAAMLEKLKALEGDEAVAPFRERLAEAYTKLGKKSEALELLGQLPETPESLETRAALAEELGRTGEALQLREKLATDDVARAKVLEGYLKADLVPFAVRLGEQLLEAMALEPKTLRLLSERLAPTAQGAALAVRAWPQLLGENPADADGWTIYAEGLRLLGRETEAALADGFGAALTSSDAASPTVRPEELDAPDAYRFPELPDGLIAVTEKSMPRLALALNDALEALGARGMTVALNPLGGVEAWQGAPQILVLGAGALAVFGQSELTYLAALALALGEGGHKLQEPGDVEGFAEAAVSAFDAYPVSLAAGRVLAHLDARTRGSDPAAVQLNEVLPGSLAFKAVAVRALQRLSRR